MPSVSLISLSSIVIGLIVLVLILYRQRQVRVVTTKLGLPSVLAVAGLAGMSGANRSITSGEIAVLVGLLATDAVGLGAVRAYTVRVWREGDRWLRQGTWVTIGLWIVGAAIHDTVDSLVGLGTASLLLYLGVTYAAQRLVLRWRIARRTSPETPSPGSTTG
jgi:hypothetical protein